MDLRLSEEEKLIRDTAARFVDRELLAREGEYLKQPELFLPPGDPPRRELAPELASLLRKCASEVGLWALELAEAQDGSVLSFLSRVLIYREFGRTILPFAPACIPRLMAQSKYAKPLVAGEVSLSLAFDEVHRTGNLTDIQTRFLQDADGLLLSDADLDIFEPGGDLFLFPARERGTERVVLLLLERGAQGISIGREVDLTTDARVGKLTLDKCRASEAQILGYEYEVGSIIAAEQLRLAARALGVGMRCLGDSIEYARHRVTFGRPLASRQAIQWMLADLSIALRTATWLTVEAAWRADQGLSYFDEAALAKKRAAKMAFEAADTAIQIHGGYGVCKEFPFEGFYREARLMRLLYGREAEMDRAAGERFLKERNRH